MTGENAQKSLAIKNDKNNKIKSGTADTVQQIIIYTIVVLFSLMCLLPFVLVIIVSLTEEKSITMNGYSFLPTHWSTSAYKMLFSPNSSVPRAYYVTGVATIIGTLIAALITFGAGYTLANKQCKYRNALSLYFYIPMVFSAGLVPWYMISKSIGAYDNLAALIVPSLLFSPFNMFLVRNFVRGIPNELNESARIDGAGEVKIAFSIYLPLCLPVIATVALFYAIGYWNNYFNAVMLINDKEYYSLQMLLFKIQSELTAMQHLAVGTSNSISPPRESFKMATSVVTMGPIILLYPFLQKYFVKGMVVGAVKG
ncbi:carbohydrate ABC transporter permease [Scatolibacter rhodanostii]|uniref:carbohydrate ABC transporter permease n=1 Tax=Scatolibacter rhodanostii TaxID=2014781 RepID=UPI000C07F269|nr:carbohydrate ABC transporter permease [Scatolibacter rhodanostii]